MIECEQSRSLPGAAREYFTHDEAQGRKVRESLRFELSRYVQCGYNTPRRSDEEEIYRLADKTAILSAPSRWDVRQASNAGSMGNGIFRNVVKSRTCQQRPAAAGVLDIPQAAPSHTPLFLISPTRTAVAA